MPGEKLVLKKHKNSGYIYNCNNNLVYRSVQDRIVIGRIDQDEFIPLDDHAISLCQQYGFRYEEEPERKQERARPKPFDLAKVVPPHGLEMFSQLPDKTRECPICTEIITENLVQTSCFHYFHQNCLSGIKTRNCPTCRNCL